VLLLLEFLAQIFFVGVAVFTVNGGQPDSEASIYAAFQSSEIWFILHGVTGLLVVSVTILTLIGLSFAARYSWGTTGLSALLFLQLVIQTLIAHPPVPPLVSGLHPVNGFLMIGLAGWLTFRNWAFGSGARVSPSNSEHRPGQISIR
jgi:hypothetical protein